MADMLVGGKKRGEKSELRVYLLVESESTIYTTQITASTYGGRT